MLLFFLFAYSLSIEEIKTIEEQIKVCLSVTFIDDFFRMIVKKITLKWKGENYLHKVHIKN